MRYFGQLCILLVAISFSLCMVVDFKSWALPARLSYYDVNLPYFLKPNPIDTMCIQDVIRARKDTAAGIIAFCVPMGFGTHQLRQEKYLEGLCRKNGLTFRYELFGCIVYSDQTDGCYGDFMDAVISKKFGAQFKDSLINAADELLIANHDTVPYYLCDRQPQIPGHNDYECTMTASPDVISRYQLQADQHHHYPFMDIGFYIDTLGQPSGYHLSFFMDADSESNHSKMKPLFEEAIKTVQQIQVWEPGEINGRKVNTRHNVRVYF